MTTTPSPFRPGFGGSPPELVGRDALIADVTSRLLPENWRTERTVLIRGLRGHGKTALLNALEDSARAHDWVVVSETAEADMKKRLERERLPRLLRDLDPSAVTRHVTGAGLTGVGMLQGSAIERHPVAATIRGQLELLCELSPTGVLITIDEMHRAAVDEMRPVLTAVQHAVREDRSIMLVGAGLPDGIDGVLKDPGLTFLRRALTFELGPLNFDESREGLEKPVIAAGRAFDDRALQLAIAVAQGQPYLVQLIGDRSWKVNPEDREISFEDVRSAAPGAIQQFGRAVLAVTLSDVTAVERQYLTAMTLDDESSSTGELAKRIGKSASAAGNARARLIDKGLVADQGYGRVTFAVPYLREYLADRTATPASTHDTALPSPAEVLRQLSSPVTGNDRETDA